MVYPIKIVNAIMMLYQSMVRSHDGDTTMFEITAGVLQGDTIAPFLFIIYLKMNLTKIKILYLQSKNERALDIQKHT